jgi:hypothetical protein
MSRDMYRKLNWQGGTPREVSEVVNNLVEGKSNNTGEITLATGGATTTTITDERIGYNSYIGLEPISMTAATDYYPYLAVQDTTDQIAASTTTAYAVTFNTTDYALGASLSNSSRLNVSYSGLYNLQFSFQFANTDSQIQDIDIWFRKNGTDVAGSNSKFSVPNSHGGTAGHLIAALNFYFELAKNDYVEIMWATTSTAVTIEQLPAQTSPTRPSTPSTIATLQYLSSNSYTTNLFTGTYVSAQTKGSATLSHPANSVSDRTYRYIIVG